MSKHLLKNVPYGNEIDQISENSNYLRESENWGEIEHIVKEFFISRKKGAFGGVITAGDALFIAEYMARYKPSCMFEIGVASGFSSAFIMYAAQRLGLVSSDKFLTSLDVASVYPDGTSVGAYVRENHLDLDRLWNLYAGYTSLEIGGEVPVPFRGQSCLAFIDGEHRHPWPSFDLFKLLEVLPVGSWILVQDVRVTERWLQDSIKFSVPCHAPIRGVSLAVNHWPGDKVIGTGLSYNMAALQVFSSLSQKHEFVSKVLRYPYEIPENICDPFSRYGKS